jgi:hypothetical protein
VRLAARIAFFVPVLLYIWVGPLLRQELNVRNDYLPQWVMFSSTSLGLLDVRYERGLPGGGREYVDHVEVLDIPAPRFRHPSRRWRITHKERRELRRMSRKLCGALGDGTELYLYTRRAVRSGWREVDRGDRDVCQKKKKKKKRGKGKKR